MYYNYVYKVILMLPFLSLVENLYYTTRNFIGFQFFLRTICRDDP